MTTSRSSRWIKSTEWLAGQLGKADVAIVDGSYYLPTQKRDAKAEYLAAHIPGAVFFDIEQIADHSTDLPHMLPGPDQFGAGGRRTRNFGETTRSSSMTAPGFFRQPRVWWTFRIFGARNVFILDGGLPAWKAEGRPTEAGDVKREKRTFNANMDTGAVAMVTDVQMALNDRKRAGRRRALGGALCRTRTRAARRTCAPATCRVHSMCPFTEIVENGRLASPERIAQAFKKAGVDPDKPVITSCGSGVTAAILTLGLEALGKKTGRDL